MQCAYSHYLGMHAGHGCALVSCFVKNYIPASIMPMLFFPAGTASASCLFPGQIYLSAHQCTSVVARLLHTVLLCLLGRRPALAKRAQCGPISIVMWPRDTQPCLSLRRYHKLHRSTQGFHECVIGFVVEPWGHVCICNFLRLSWSVIESCFKLSFARLSLLAMCIYCFRVA